VNDAPLCAEQSTVALVNIRPFALVCTTAVAPPPHNVLVSESVEGLDQINPRFVCKKNPRKDLFEERIIVFAESITIEIPVEVAVPPLG
jgi:hypothetical protein